MSFAPKSAMVLAAGFGTRMRPITDHIPKPLVSVAGRTMLDRALDHLKSQNVTNVVVNAHYLAAQIAAHVAGMPHIRVSLESEILETGGGVVKALPMLGDDPFFVCNSDIIWTDGATPALKRLADAFDPAIMDGLLLLAPTSHSMGYDGVGDFHLDPSGIPRRRAEGEVTPLLFAGVQILSPQLFDGLSPDRFSLNIVYDRALANNRLRAIVHDGKWFHVGTPEALPQVEQALFTLERR